MSSLAFDVRDKDCLAGFGLRPGGRFQQWLATLPRYVLCDVDGTLLGAADGPTPAVIDAVAAARQAQLRVGIATGRMRASVEDLIATLGADGPHVFHNGAEVSGSDIAVRHWPLTAEAVDELIALAADMTHGYVEVCTSAGYYVTSMDERAAAHWQMLGAPPQGVILSRSDLGGLPALKATVVLFGQPRTRVDAVGAHVEAMGLAVGSARSPRTPALDYLNVTAPQVNKGTAAHKAVTSLALSVDQLAAIGDEANDLPLFALAGTAVAMGQADDEVVRAAHLVAPAVSDDGAARALHFLTRVATGW